MNKNNKQKNIVKQDIEHEPIKTKDELLIRLEVELNLSPSLQNLFNVLFNQARIESSNKPKPVFPTSKNNNLPSGTQDYKHLDFIGTGHGIDYFKLKNRLDPERYTLVSKLFVKVDKGDPINTNVSRGWVMGYVTTEPAKVEQLLGEG